MTFEDLCKQKIVEAIVYNINRNERAENLKDLCQDIYLLLLTKPRKYIQELIDKNEISYYIARIAYNQICSSTSPYHRIYRRENLHLDNNGEKEKDL